MKNILYFIGIVFSLNAGVIKNSVEINHKVYNMSQEQVMLQDHEINSTDSMEAVYYKIQFKKKLFYGIYNKKEEGSGRWEIMRDLKDGIEKGYKMYPFVPEIVCDYLWTNKSDFFQIDVFFTILKSLPYDKDWELASITAYNLEEFLRKNPNLIPYYGYKKEFERINIILRDVFSGQSDEQVFNRLKKLERYINSHRRTLTYTYAAKPDPQKIAREIAENKKNLGGLSSEEKYECEQTFYLFCKSIEKLMQEKAIKAALVKARHEMLDREISQNKKVVAKELNNTKLRKENRAKYLTKKTEEAFVHFVTLETKVPKIPVLDDILLRTNRDVVKNNPDILNYKKLCEVYKGTDSAQILNLYYKFYYRLLPAKKLIEEAEKFKQHNDNEFLLKIRAYSMKKNNAKLIDILPLAEKLVKMSPNNLDYKQYRLYLDHMINLVPDLD